MSVCFFLTFDDPSKPPSKPLSNQVGRLDESDRRALGDALRRIPQLRRGLIHTPAPADDPYLAREQPPALVLQLYFDRIEALERAAGPAGPLQALAAPGTLPSLAGVPVSQQAMLTRQFPLAGPAADESAPATRCTYLVGYQGPAEDLNAWLAHYIENHPPIMAKFADIREIEVCTRLDWYGSLPWARQTHMLRNKVVFDSPLALTQALRSEVRHEMRADYAALPPFAGRVFHYAMATTALTGCD